MGGRGGGGTMFSGYMDGIQRLKILYNNFLDYLSLSCSYLDFLSLIFWTISFATPPLLL